MHCDGNAGGVGHGRERSVNGAIAKWCDPKVLRFVLTGGLNTLFGYAVFSALLWFSLQYLLALMLATIAGVIFNYFSFGRLVFRSEIRWRVFAKFTAAYVVIYAVNGALLAMLTKYCQLSPYLGQIICIPVSVALSWVLMNHWVYKKD